MSESLRERFKTAVTKSCTRAGDLAKAIAATGKLMLTKLRDFFTAPKYTETKEYKAAADWLKSFEAEDSTEYDKAIDYAWKMFEQVSTTSETLDRKAENLMRLVGLVGGLLALAVNTFEVALSRMITLPLLVLICSLFFALQAYTPAARAVPARASDLLDDLTKRGKGNRDIDAYLAGSIHCATAGIQGINRWKANKLWWSAWMFLIGLVLLAINIGIAEAKPR